MEKLWQTYPNLTKAVFEAHKTRKMAQGHDFDHAFAVAQLAYRFCELRAVKELAWMAGLCHNADRMIAFDRGMPRQEVPEVDVSALVREWLGSEKIDIGIVVEPIVFAVLNHGKPNEKTDTAVTIDLKDADRVVNARLDVVIRSGQFHPDQPVLHPKLLLDDVRGKYNGRLTVMADLVDCLEWGNLKDERFCVRTPKARKMIVDYVAELRAFLKKLVNQRRREGLVPYPEELISS